MHQRDPGGDLAQFGEVALDVVPQGDAQLRRQAPVAVLDGAQLLLLRLTDGGIQESLEAVGDAGNGRMHDEYARAAGAALGRDTRDVRPVG